MPKLKGGSKSRKTSAQSFDYERQGFGIRETPPLMCHLGISFLVNNVSRRLENKVAGYILS